MRLVIAVAYYCSFVDSDLLPLSSFFIWWCLQFCPSIHPSLHPPIRASIRPSIHPSGHPFVHPSIHPFIRSSLRTDRLSLCVDLVTLRELTLCVKHYRGSSKPNLSHRLWEYKCFMNHSCSHTLSCLRTRSMKNFQQFSLVSIRPWPRTSFLKELMMFSTSSSGKRSGISPVMKTKRWRWTQSSQTDLATSESKISVLQRSAF